MGIVRIAGALALGTAVLAACGPADQDALQRSLPEEFQADRQSIWDLFAGADVDTNVDIAVNRYLWSAALDVLNFLPLEAADPFGGLIVTDWGLPQGASRPVRVTVFIQEPALDARSLRVAAFEQVGGRAVPMAASANRQLEDAILTRARQLRIAEARR